VEQLHHWLLDWLGDDGQVDWSRASIDSVSVRARRGELTGANPVDRGRPGSKYHLLIDAAGLPLTVDLSAANIHDSQLLEQLVDAVPWSLSASPGAPSPRLGVSAAAPPAAARIGVVDHAIGGCASVGPAMSR
jgi:hypothetical protein